MSSKIKAAGSPEILIVEDSPTQAMELKLTLEQCGFRALVAGNGREALAWLSRKRPDMVISDIVMPQLDGYELCRAMRKNPDLRDIPIVLLSFLSDSCDILMGLESGASNFIVKPYNADYLVDYVRKELSSKTCSKAELLQTPVTLEYAGKKYSIDANPRQILEVLLATYGTAVRKNEELIKAENELRLLNDQLEQKVMDRTAALTAENAERRRIEEELLIKSEKLTAYSARLEQSNRDLQDFAFVASHDLQEPVRKIQTFADRINKSYSHLLDERGRDYLARVCRSARRMQELVMDLLKYSRLASTSEKFPPVDLTRSVHEAISDLKVLCEEADARIEVGNLPMLEADPVQMRQLFQNLLGNALKYRADKSPLVRVYTQPCQCQGFCEIRVEDNGIGFDECYLENIFKPFQRLHGKNSPYEGTGMGLAICRRIVERHGGTITARSRSRMGSVFIVRLPEKRSFG